MPEVQVIIIVFVSLVAGLGFFILGWIAANKVNVAKMRSAEAYARSITEDAEREAENARKTALLDAKDEWYRERAKFEEETRDARQELERLQQELDRRDVWQAWQQGELPTEKADYKHCHRYMGQHGLFGDEYIEWAERGRELVEEAGRAKGDSAE